jgi:hypothetical protein
LPIFLLPLDREKPSDIRYRIGQDIQTEIEGMIKNPTDGGILVPTNEVLPRDPKKIETVFQQLCKENGIEDPLNQNAFIMLRGVASRTYAGSGDAATYNKKLANERALAFKAYLQDKYGIPNDHFIADAFHKDTMVPDDYPENRQ